VPPQPALRDRALDAGAVFGRTAAGGEKGAIDPLDIDADGLCGIGDLDQLWALSSGCDIAQPAPKELRWAIMPSA
jgi:hypothetical protein